MLRISFPPMRVFVDNVRMQPKVAPVLALMAVRAKQYPPEQAWVSAAEVALLPDWSTSKSKSVGTEVYNALRRLGLQQSGWVESPHLGKVTQWRFKESIEVNWQPDFNSVARALVNTERAATAAQSAATPFFKELLENNPLWDLMEPPHEHGPLNRAQSLAQQATLLLQKGDSSTAATLFNTAGCIANAEHSFEDSKRWLLTAIPLLLAHGALIEFEAALYNLSTNCARRNDAQASVA